jgi:hypothetical protein
MTGDKKEEPVKEVQEQLCLIFKPNQKDDYKYIKNLMCQ